MFAEKVKLAIANNKLLTVVTMPCIMDFSNTFLVLIQGYRLLQGRSA
jgi:hypothetical protein